MHKAVQVSAVEVSLSMAEGLELGDTEGPFQHKTSYDSAKHFGRLLTNVVMRTHTCAARLLYSWYRLVRGHKKKYQ